MEDSFIWHPRVFYEDSNLGVVALSSCDFFSRSGVALRNQIRIQGKSVNYFALIWDSLDIRSRQRSYLNV